jgi:hypothetical protein
MSFLAPLYFLAALGIALPVIFHMIRRQPRGRVPFGSIMFLSPSPPRLVRRSRVDDWLLLLLRGLVLGLLAWAFARPYWRSSDDNATLLPARYRVILLDTSASMQREDLWQQALGQARQVIDQSGPTDVVALYTFDQSVQPIVTIDQALQQPAGDRLSQLRSSMDRLKPSWRATNLGQALTTVADSVSIRDDAEDGSSAGRVEVLLVSDLQTGAKLDQLERYQWPGNVTVDVRLVAAKQSSNAYFQSITASPGSDEEAATNRVLIANEPTSEQDQFQLEWRGADDARIGNAISSNVPPGQTKTVRVPSMPKGASSIVLVGDKQSFDNQHFMASTPRKQQQLIFVGDSQAGEPTSRPSYFLEKLPLGNDLRDVQFVTRSPMQSDPWPARKDAPLVVIGSNAVADLDGLAQQVQLGSHVLWVLDQPMADEAMAKVCLENLNKLAGPGIASIREATVKDYAMLSQIDFSHPLFAELADPKFNDFSKIRFWRHRHVDLESGDNESKDTGAENSWRRIASFDDGSAAILEKVVGEGRIWVLCAGWYPDESQFAMSSKFVTIMMGMYELAEPNEPWRDSVIVGDDIELPQDAVISLLASANGSGTAESEELRIEDGRFRPAVPGVYQFTSAGNSGQFAVNLSVEESSTEPMDISRLEQLGVAFSKSANHDELVKQARQKQVTELESTQQLWRWLLLAAVVFILGETLLASRAIKQSPATAAVR